MVCMIGFITTQPEHTRSAGAGKFEFPREAPREVPPNGSCDAAFQSKVQVRSSTSETFLTFEKSNQGGLYECCKKYVVQVVFVIISEKNTGGLRVGQQYAGDWR